MITTSTFGVKYNTMTKKFFGLMAALAVLAFATAAQAGSIDVTRMITRVSTEAAAAGAPQNGVTGMFSVTTDGDILSVNNVMIELPAGVSLYNNTTFGSNVEPPNPALIPIARDLEADSWISTPGATSLLGPDFPGDGTSTWGDLVDSGPQSNFKFATLSMPAQAKGWFNFRVSIADPTAEGGIYTESFRLAIPEPASAGLLGMSLLGLASLRRRFLA